MTEATYTPSFPISRDARKKLKLPNERFNQQGHLLIRSRREARELATLYAEIDDESNPTASDLYGASYVMSAWSLLLGYFSDGSDPYEKGALDAAERKLPPENLDIALKEILNGFPDDEMWQGEHTPGEALEVGEGVLSGSERALNRGTLVRLGLTNPAFTPFNGLFTPPEGESGDVTALWDCVEELDPHREAREPEQAPPLATLRKPVQAAPDSVKDQLLYILTRWGSLLEKLAAGWAVNLIGALDMIEEETRPRFGGPGPARRPTYSELDGTARFSSDDDWMPRVVLLAKNVLVWLNQLSKRYGRTISTLDAVPDEELDLLASRSFNALWLIGLWERSAASREIKRRMGNPEAAASAYSLYGYEIAQELGGWEALGNLRSRAEARGIRLSSDMVPNHVGLDSDWVRHFPDRLLSSGDCPYPAYSFNSDNLSGDDRIDIRLEDHYWDRSDAAVVFQRIDRSTGDTRFIYHGNDGTTMPWNDTAQIDFLNPEAREAVIRDILHVARNFSIIRFDAAMVLARKHIRRLWYPAPGAGGAIPSRSEYALSDEDFMAAIPNEFWREVVDRIAAEVPGTLLLAEAFWMMEGYFVRALGMHRVYNSAFMNMLRDQQNNEYRDMIKETLAFDPRILQRFVNFMNNPDEETAVEQFGRDDRYFAVCTLLATLPGLPMFGHGQIEGLSEKYGMEYIRAYREEDPDFDLINRHEREIFPLIARRSLFSGAAAFRLYDLHTGIGINENLFAYTNGDENGRTLVIVNNAYERADGTIHRAAPVNIGEMNILNEHLGSSLGLDECSDDSWLLMKEHITGLWYLRSVGSIRSEGLTVMIDGFGRQVFMDFRVEQECSDGRWGKLAAELNGRGTPDPDTAVSEIRLRPIHSVLDQVYSRDLIAGLADSIRRGKRPVFETHNAEALMSLPTLNRELYGESPGEEGAMPSAAQIAAHTTRRLASSATLWRFFGGSLRRQLSRRYGDPEWDAPLMLTLWSLMRILPDLVFGQSSQRPLLEIWDSWGLEKWLRNGRLPEGSEQMVAALEIAIGAEGWTDNLPGTGTALSELMSDRRIRETCGVNAWDGILWYDKLGWIITVQAVILTAAADSGSGTAGRRNIRALKRTLRKWYGSDKKADYHLDRLLTGAR